MPFSPLYLETTLSEHVPFLSLDYATIQFNETVLSSSNSPEEWVSPPSPHTIFNAVDPDPSPAKVVNITPLTTIESEGQSSSPPPPIPHVPPEEGIEQMVTLGKNETPGLGNLSELVTRKRKRQDEELEGTTSKQWKRDRVEEYMKIQGFDVEENTGD